MGGSRWLPVRYEEGPVGGSANYWMTSEVASLFHKAKNGKAPSTYCPVPPKTMGGTGLDSRRARGPIFGCDR